MKLATCHVGQHELGVDVRSISQVLDYPATLVENPEADSRVKALFSWGGRMLPLLDASAALGTQIPGNFETLDRKVVVLTDGTLTAGFAVSALGGIVTLEETDINRWDKDVAVGTSLIDAVATLDDGKRVIEILDPVAWLELAGFSGSTREGAGEDLGGTRDSKRLAGVAAHITFESAGIQYALPVSLIVELVALGEIIDSLLVSTRCIGMMPYRGGRLPIVPFAALMNSAPVGEIDAAAKRVIVVAWGEDKVGLLVDAAHGIEPLDNTVITPLVNEVDVEPLWFQGIARGADGVERLVVDADRIRGCAELASIAKGYGNIYGRHSLLSDRRSRYNRKYYLLFKLRELLAVEMEELKEIIHLPQGVVRPPGLADYLLGIHSLRGEAVTLLDGRRIYDLPPRNEAADSEPSKVLIFHHAGLKLGVVVDSVESIVAADTQSTIPIPRSLMGRLSTEFESDVKEFVEVADLSSRRNLKFIVLEFSRVFDRLRIT